MGGHQWTANRRGGSGGWVVAAAVLLSVVVAIDRVPPGFGQDRAGRGQIGSLGQTALFGPAPNVNGILPQSLGYTSAYQEKARCRPGNSSAGGKPNLPGRPGPFESVPLRSGQPVSDGVKSGFYVSSVGGIAFDQVARPAGRLTIERLELKYNAKRADGSRLSVVLNDRVCSTQGLPDWQLLPIACFADSPYFGAVTLFGELAAGQARPPGTKYVVSYHPAFESTLLGLRLWQGDIMLLDPNTTGELPQYSGRYLLGSGEQAPNRQVWQPASAALNQLLTRGDRFVSYVICDAASPPTFGMGGRPGTRGRQLGLQGTVYFYFWRRGPEQTERVVDSDHGVRLYRSFQPEQLVELSNALSSQTALLGQVNPAVYRSMYNTMVYAAFFRYAKEHDGVMWEAFLDSLVSIRGPAFAAPTPTVMKSATQQRH